MEENNKANEVSLTESEVWDIVNFARGLSGGLYGTSYLSPDLISGRMKDVTLNPLAPTEEMLASAMANPKEYEKQLQEFSQSFELSSMVYKRLISYLANMLAFDITYVSSAKPDEYKTPKYKKDLDIVENFLEKFEYKKEFRIVVREMLRNDAYFGCFYNVGEKYILQELPSEYCKITGRWEGGFLFSFNMYWFLQPGVDIDMYPPFFKKKYNEIWKNKQNKGYYPSISPELRGQSSWIYWVDIPVDVGVCFKFSPELAARLPYFSPLFNDLVLQPLMRSLQKNSNMAAASKMIVGQVPLLNKDAKSTVKDSIAISPDLLGKFLALVKSAISESIKIASAPLEDIQGISFDSDETIYDSYLKTALASSGVNSNLIFTNNIKPNVIETQLSLNVDEQMMTALYEQFEPFMNYQVNKLTKNFKFYINFEGTDFYIDRQNRFEKAMSLFDKGIVMPQKIAASIGMKPSHMRKHMEESNAMDFISSLTPPAFVQQKEMADINAKNTEKQQAINMKNQEEKVPATQEAKKGRPRKKDSEISEEGAQTRTQGTNVGRGGKE